MALLLNVQGLEKSFGSTRLFEGISLTISDGDRIGLIGPNGSGKSTLLKILAGMQSADKGEVALKKLVRIAYVAQESDFPEGSTVQSVVDGALHRAGIAEADGLAIREETIGRAGIPDRAAETGSLSGGWRKRLAIVEALVTAPDILLLDEPTNHLDLSGIAWLEGLLANARFASLVISHDRYFLENVASAMIELHRAYPSGLFRAPGNYSAFLEKKAEFLHAQAKRQESLENRVRTEMEWLRRGPKARTTKSKARINNANELIDELADLSARSRTSSAGIDFQASDRATKRLIELEGVAVDMGGRNLFRRLDLVLSPRSRIGLAGPNGSGKTTLLRLLRNEIQPTAGGVRRADPVRVVYFDQTREIDPSLTLRQALAPDGDSFVYRDRAIHVASWAARFLFTNDQLPQPVGKLSGGERARVLIARLMLEPADVLLLDEPTNDLDIPTLEILEDNLLDFPGAMVLVTHDRYMLDRVSTSIVGLDGTGEAGAFADFSQWEDWLRERQTVQARGATGGSPEPVVVPPPRVQKKLSYLDQRDYETIEHRIVEAESLVAETRSRLDLPEVYTDPAALQTVVAEVETLQENLDSLYARWSELEAKLG